ncbi:MAG: hypothetical protein RDU20_21720 [Desulfomonilaceae bacterium]|nr:hypothetical protein [Desulfomonilaceae bacterium]
MKKVFCLLMLAAFVFSVSVAVAGERPNLAQAQPGQPQPGQTVNCCVNGECKKAASAAMCEKLGGKVVKDCKDCK